MFSVTASTTIKSIPINWTNNDYTNFNGRRMTIRRNIKEEEVANGFIKNWLIFANELNEWIENLPDITIPNYNEIHVKEIYGDK